jgi:hypothetical protein
MHIQYTMFLWVEYWKCICCSCWCCNLSINEILDLNTNYHCIYQTHIYYYCQECIHHSMLLIPCFLIYNHSNRFYFQMGIQHIYFGLDHKTHNYLSRFSSNSHCMNQMMIHSSTNCIMETSLQNPIHNYHICLDITSIS